MAFTLNPFTGQFDATGTGGGGGGGGSASYKDPVANAAALPTLGNSNGDVRVSLAESQLWEWNGSSWTLLSGTPTFNNNRVIITSGSGTLADNSANPVQLVSSTFQRAQTAGSAFVEEQYIDSTTLTDNTSGNIAALDFLHATYAGFSMDYIIKTGSTPPAIRIGTFKVVSNGTNMQIADTFNETSDAGVTFTVSISGTSTNVGYTTTTQETNRLLRADVKRFRA